MLDFSACGAIGSGAPSPSPAMGVFCQEWGFSWPWLQQDPERLTRVFLGLLTRGFSSDRDNLGKEFPRDCNIPSSLSEQEQYHFCYDIALEYLESLETR